MFIYNLKIVINNEKSLNECSDLRLSKIIGWQESSRFFRVINSCKNSEKQLANLI